MLDFSFTNEKKRLIQGKKLQEIRISIICCFTETFPAEDSTRC